MFYLIKTPWWLSRWVFPAYTWQMPSEGKKLYLSFDDGPHAEATPFALDTLKQYNAKATFFCIGKNVQAEPELYRRIIMEGHIAGNHTFDHLNGWKTDDKTYLAGITQAAKYIDSALFRPPYGRITRFQARMIKEKLGLSVIMWSVLSGDFDKALSPAACLENVVRNSRAGSIIVFHDSEKALPRMRYALPRVLAYFTEKGYRFEGIQIAGKVGGVA